MDMMITQKVEAKGKDYQIHCSYLDLQLVEQEFVQLILTFLS